MIGRLQSLGLLGITLLLSACPSDGGATGVVGSAPPKKSASPTSTTNPGIISGQTQTGAPGASSPTPSPTYATPVPASVTSVGVSPLRATLTLPAANAANSAGFPSSIQLSALVRYSDNSTSASVSWNVTPAILTISSAGLVTAQATGIAVVTATSTQDPTKSGTASITVVNNGELDLTIN